MTSLTILCSKAELICAHCLKLTGNTAQQMRRVKNAGVHAQVLHHITPILKKGKVYTLNWSVQSALKEIQNMSNGKLKLITYKIYNLEQQFSSFHNHTDY